MGEMGKTVEFEARLFQLLEEAVTWPKGERRERAEQICRSGPVSAPALIEALERGDQPNGFLEQSAWQDITGAIAAGSDN